LIQADSATTTYINRIARCIVPEMAIFASFGSKHRQLASDPIEPTLSAHSRRSFAARHSFNSSDGAKVSFEQAERQT
jgi:hypothetical protein